MDEKEKIKAQRLKEMKECALQWAHNHWPDDVKVDFGDIPGAPFINIVDPRKVLMAEDAVDFYEYLSGLFPDLIRWE